jgi:hypothetical protein
MAADRGAHFGGRHVFGHHPPRNLPGCVDPLDDPASAAPRLVNRCGDPAAAHLEVTLDCDFM